VFRAKEDLSDTSGLAEGLEHVRNSLCPAHSGRISNGSFQFSLLLYKDIHGGYTAALYRKPH